MNTKRFIALAGAAVLGSSLLLGGCGDREAGGPAASPTAGISASPGTDIGQEPGNSASPSSSSSAEPEGSTGKATPKASVPAGKSDETTTPSPDATAKGKPSGSKPTASPAGTAVQTVAKPADMQVLVNKTRALPANYVPSDLTEPNVLFPYKEKLEKRLMRKEAAEALEKLFAGASKDGIKLYAVSGYRSYATQKSLYNSYVKKQGEALANKYSAKPGMSEHQTGLAMDVSTPGENFQLEATFGDTTEGKWLAKHASEYGFIIRYPRGKEHITGYNYEPWHIRFIGTDIAKDIYEQGVTLEEYFKLAVPVSGQ